MEKIKEYINETLGVRMRLEPVQKENLNKLPFYIKEAFHFDYAWLYNNSLILAEIKTGKNFTTAQLDKQLDILKNAFNKKAVLVIDDLSAIERKRLIHKGVNFIIPGKQLFLPDLLIDLREYQPRRKHQKEKLLPSAQYILLYKILHRNEPLEEWTFKQLAEKFQYTQTAITKAAGNLKNLGLCTIEGTKEKYIRFNKEIKELWNEALPFFTTPVIKKVYTDKLPDENLLLRCNMSALPEYSDMADSKQQYFAIEKGLFHTTKKLSPWLNLNDREGNYCLEVWKYNPSILAENITYDNNVDPLSLYLSLRENKDARIEMAMEQIIKKYIW